MESLPTIDTNRLRLRKLSADDIPNIMKHANNRKVTDMTLNMPYPYEADDAINWIHKGNEGLKDDTHIIFAITKRTDDVFMGGISLRVNKRFNRAELGFWLGEPFWNNGYMSEAVQAALMFGFSTLKLHKIVAHHMIHNPASGNVMQKNDMVREAELKDHIRKDDTYYSLILYRITRPEFESLEG